ncbi:hypothetical protein CJF30_00011031 [Rutstroemia sp. NJR-2017a BBW]|nr:hypothetical protein CJF30_00011031 [Rutstroemia sp. NJR-2017a BBW]
MAPPTILIVGATGNTGRNVVETLSELSKTSKALQGHRFLALTRSSSSGVAQKLAKLSGVSIEEENWVDITSDWLKERNVVKAFIAPHSGISHFAEESSFHLAALDAGVKYVVRISTTAANVRPNQPAFYPRQHWAVEQQLGSPEFNELQWTSLQPNLFFSHCLGNAADYIKSYRKDGKHHQLLIPIDETVPDDHSVHNKQKYELNGPENINGRQIVELVEKHIGAKVEDVKFRDVSFTEPPVDLKEGRSLLLSVKNALVNYWVGKATNANTSKEFLELAPPKVTPANWLENAVQE